jgi:hypothetical protein
MTRDIRKSLDYFKKLTKSKTSRKGNIYSNELQELFNIALEKATRPSGRIDTYVFAMTFWEVGYAMGYKCAKNGK